MKIGETKKQPRQIDKFMLEYIKSQPNQKLIIIIGPKDYKKKQNNSIS